MREVPPSYAQDDIAIVGMACVFPGADTPAGFWQNIVDRVDCISDDPTSWDAQHYCQLGNHPLLPVYTPRGGYLGELSRFNPAKYGVMPAGVDGAEPDQFLALRVAFAALADAGVPERPLNRERTGVILGRGVYINRGVLSLLMHGYALDQFLDVLRQLEPDRSEEDLIRIRAELQRHLAPYTTEVVPGLMHCSMTGRIANRLNLNGPVYTVDAACASTLVAAEHGIRELRAGRCDAVLVGGVQVSSLVFVHQLFCRLQALSRSGVIAPFSAKAQGTLLGEGCGMVLLKRRRDAERDGHPIYALIKEIGVSSDGRGAGLLAPKTEGQQLALRRAYEQSGIAPASLELVEAHGTGIPLGDQTEVNTLTACFGTRQGEFPTIALGSVKSMIGHLIPASGAASLIKMALALHHRTLPPTLHAEEAHPDLGLEKTPFYLSTEPRPWCHGDRETPRRAGINAFGFGGINAHAILEEYTATEETNLERLEKQWPAELVVVSAADPPALRERARFLAAWVSRAKGVRLLDIAASCAAETGPCRLTLVVPTVEELAKKLEHAAKLLEQEDRERIQDRSGIFWYREPLARTGRVAFVFPGEGAQYPNMLADLCRHFPEVRQAFDRTDAALQSIGQQPLSRIIFPPPREAARAESVLYQLDGAVVGVAAAERALLALLKRLQVEPAAVVGHSTGEFGAFQAAGTIVFADEKALLQAVAAGAENAAWLARSELVPRAVLTSVGGADPTAVRQALADLGGRVVLAMDNCPHQQILVGDEEASEAFVAALRGKGGLCERLPWGRAYHTEAIVPALPAIEEYYHKLRLGTPRIELWSCTTAERYPPEPAAVHELAVRQWRSPVRFRETIQAMHAAGVRVFLEVGPRGNLSAFVSDTLGKLPHAAIPLDVARRNGLEQLCRAVGMMVAHGVALDLAALYRPRRPRLLDLNTDPPAEPAAEPVLPLMMPDVQLSPEVVAWWHNSRPGAGKRETKPEAAEAPEPTIRPAAARHADDPRMRALADYQQTMRQFLETQEKVALAKFGREAPPRTEDPGWGDTRRLPPAGLEKRLQPVAAATETNGNSAPPIAAPKPHPVAAPPAPAPQPVSAAPVLSLEGRLLEIVSQRTGYPREMLDLDANLEADLGIDSIKRVEVIGAFRREVLPALKDPPTDYMERMTAARTLRAILDGMAELLGSTPGTAVSSQHLSRDISTLFGDAVGHEMCTICEALLEGPETSADRTRILADAILDAEERQAFGRLKLPADPALSWLLGRAAAKDAVRRHLALEVAPTAIGISSDAQGRPGVRVPEGRAPVVSLAHKEQAAVAAAAAPDRFAGIGIDLEPLTALDAGVKADGFTDEERTRIEAAARQSGEPADHWYLAAWCAKEAVGKALGRGVVGGPRSVEVTGLEPATGRLSLALRGALAVAFPAYADQPGREVRIPAVRRVHQGRMLALCLLPRIGGSGFPS
jgi:acyl transferase domain-containing protein/phosphopantetheinyl transferase